MKCNYSLTFEFETQQPLTVKGEAIGTSIRTIAARAIDDAKRKHPKVSWRSLVLVLERDIIEIEPETPEETVS